jgi:hypothetical protein
MVANSAHSRISIAEIGAPKLQMPKVIRDSQDLTLHPTLSEGVAAVRL